MEERNTLSETVCVSPAITDWHARNASTLETDAGESQA